MSNAVDLATRLNADTVAALVKNGVTTVGRYLSRNTKGLTLDEVKVIKAAGLQIFSIYETNPTFGGYFTTKQAQYDANDSLGLAHSVGQPTGTSITFPVDYDAPTKDFDEILTYFQTLKPIVNAKGYKVIAYGSYAVLNFLHSHNAADGYFQTVAWSNGQHCNFLNLFQYQCDKKNWNNTGLDVDLVNLEKGDIGAWGQPQFKAASIPVAKVIGTVTINYPKGYGINAYYSPNGAFKEKIPGGSSWKCYAEQDDFYGIGANCWVPKKYCTFKGV